MADIVLGIGTSHTPQISADWKDWPNLGKQPNPSPYIPEDLDEQLTPEVHERRWRTVQADIKVLGDKLRSADLDAVVIFGDDQHEQFHDENMPAIAIYHGETAEVHKRSRPPGFPQLRFEETKPEYPVAGELASTLITSLVDREFDISRVSQLKEERGIGHAFSFLYQRLWPECDVPIVPIMINTYYPPNAPTPKRCWNLGQAVASALAEWGPGKRVAIMASGGLSHIMLDEEVDHQALDGLQSKAPELLWSLPRERLVGGTSEILNWVALGGATQHLTMNLLDYIPGYRSLPSTGCAMTFAYWE